MLYCVTGTFVDRPFARDEEFAVIPAKAGDALLELAAAFSRMCKAFPEVARIEACGIPVAFYSLLPECLDDLLDKHRSCLPYFAEAGYAFVETNEPDVIEDIKVKACQETTGTIYRFVNDHCSPLPDILVSWAGVPQGCTRLHTTQPVPLWAWEHVLLGAPARHGFSDRREARVAVANTSQYETRNTNLGVQYSR
jgi:hypothetical protein